jgi:molybdopterin molybdotransferase
MSLSVVDPISAKLSVLRDALRRVESEQLPVSRCIERVLAERVTAFRDSPAVDVSAMDGYAVRLADIGSAPMPVAFVATAGSEPRSLPLGVTSRIFTGGPLPAGAECVIPREQCREGEGSVDFLVAKESVRLGQHIRRRGENALRGSVVMEAGKVISGPVLSTLVSFLAGDSVKVHRPVRVAIINTGDELIDLGQPMSDWHIRDSNGPLLDAMLRRHAWIEAHRTKVRDDFSAVRSSIAEALAVSDALLLTGGVSMGDTDYVPKAIEACGAEIKFHRIPIRPGKPLLGAVGPNSQLILGLPGNPLSVAVTYRRYGLPLLKFMAGIAATEALRQVEIANPDTKTLDLVWFRLVSLAEDGSAALVSNQGSGDVASLGVSDGFIEVAPGKITAGRLPYFDWRS